MRRLAAAAYDVLLLIAVLAVATACWLPFTGGEAVRPHHPLYGAFLVGVSFLFFGWSWVRGGQTLGMRAWGIRLYGTGGEPVGWNRAALRFAAAWLSLAGFGLGFLWPALSPERASWHDLLSGTRIDWA